MSRAACRSSLVRELARCQRFEGNVEALVFQPPQLAANQLSSGLSTRRCGVDLMPLLPALFFCAQSNQMDWMGLDRMGLGWIGFGWIGLHWIALDCEQCEWHDKTRPTRVGKERDR